MIRVSENATAGKMSAALYYLAGFVVCLMIGVNSPFYCIVLVCVLYQLNAHVLAIYFTEIIFILY